MMALATSHAHLIDRLPKPRGRLVADAPLGPQTWFRTGGPAEVLFRPADPEDLATFLSALPADVPVTVLGVGSNLLVRDGGVKGVVIRLMRGFTAITADGNGVLAGAGDAVPGGDCAACGEGEAGAWPEGDGDAADAPGLGEGCAAAGRGEPDGAGEAGAAEG